jgi:hypothetical protein
MTVLFRRITHRLTIKMEAHKAHNKAYSRAITYALLVVCFDFLTQSIDAQTTIIMH